MTVSLVSGDIAYLDKNKIITFLKAALEEDIGPGDYSSLASIDAKAKGEAELIIKEQGVLAGLEVALEVFSLLDQDLQVTTFFTDGARVNPGDRVLKIKGKAQSILSAERLALNIMQRMSGIATKSADLSSLIGHTKCRLLDTRKTTPNFRMFEKWAVLIGGGRNHRFALYDMVMLKDNHVDYSGGITQAISNTRDYLRTNKLDLKIEVETRTLDEVREAIEVAADIILLDNMTVEQMAAAVKLVAGRAKTEASGGITEETIVAIAETGVDYISVGALTHSYNSLDMSLKARIE